MKTLLRGLVLLLATGAALAVPTLRLELPRDIDLYYVGDLDPAGTMSEVGENIWLVIDGLTETGTYSMSLALSYGGEQLASGSLEAVNVTAPPQGTVRISLSAIRSNQVVFGDVSARGRGTYNEDFIDRISGNALPTGVYMVNGSIRMPSGALYSEQDMFVLTDPRRVDLLLPLNGLPIFGDQPTFSWTGRARQYAVRVCAFDPELHASPLEAIESDPEWEALVDRTSVVYGSEGLARPLRPGTVYVWMVEAVLNTSSGERRFPSAVRSFQVREGHGGDDERLLANLLDGLTPSQLAGIATLLEGLSLNGPIVIDGQEASPDELRAFVQRLADGELNVSSIRVE